MIEPQPNSSHSHVSSTQICNAFGLGRQELQHLADREGFDQFAGMWGLDEVKKMAIRLLVGGSEKQKANARTVIRQIADLEARDD